METELQDLLPKEILTKWYELTETIDSLYDVDKMWNKGFGDWDIEYKYRRGGKTLCTLYAKQDVATLLITYGKAERDKFEQIGKWLWIPVDEALDVQDIIMMLRIKRRPNRK